MFAYIQVSSRKYQQQSITFDLAISSYFIQGKLKFISLSTQTHSFLTQQQMDGNKRFLNVFFFFVLQKTKRQYQCEGYMLVVVFIFLISRLSFIAAHSVFYTKHVMF